MADFAIFNGPTATDDAKQLCADCHKLRGGDYSETGARGVGPTARAWLARNGPPTTTGYSTPVEASGEVRVLVTPDIVTELAAEDARPTRDKRLDATETTRVRAAVLGRVERSRATRQ